MARKSAMLLIFTLVVLLVSENEAKTFKRCELVRELRRQGFPNDKMANWVCLVESESSSNTGKVNTNKNGSKDYGLFQINDNYWCTRSGPAGKDCNVKCSDVMTDNITKASACALKIYRRHGFRAWYGWRNKCDGKSLPDISKC